MKILIIDDHILFAEGIKYILESYEDNIKTLYASDFNAAIDVINKSGHPDLILLDINLSDTNGITLIKKFQNLNIWSPILIISASDSTHISSMALEEGALGFVSKSCDSITLLHAIKTVMKGDIYTPFQEPVVETDTTKNIINGLNISSRQYEILHLLSQGKHNKQIALELNISSNTVKAHLHVLFKHLNVNNRTAAVQSAHKYGLL